ncbi:unnamed protein product, partial [Ectocarpus sp. 12 AP-2014]
KSRGISQRAAANYNRFASATPTANTAAAVTRGKENSIIGRGDALGSGVATDNQRQEDERQEEEEEETERTFSVVFMTQSLGIILAASDDGDKSLVVCDKEDTTNPSKAE